MKTLSLPHNIILLGIGLLIVISMPLIHTADAQTPRELENDYKNKITSLNDKLDDIKIDLINQNEIINNHNDIIEQKKNDLRNIKAEVTGNPSYDAITWINTAEDNLRTAQTNYDKARDKLFSLYNERSNHINEIKSLNELLLLLPRAATPYHTNVKLIGVTLSDSCLIISTCPTYDTMISLDSSNRIISGDFSGEPLRREPSPVKNSWRFYDTDDTPRVIIDPPKGMHDRIPLITIVPSLDTYKIKSDMGNGTNRILFHDRYIDNCKNAVLSSKVWKEVLPITIFDLRNNCELSEFTEREVIPLEKSPIDITTSPNWQAAQKLESDKQRCKGLCFEY